MDFNCDFNAPMFVDFQSEDMDNNPESYFDIDHEAVIPTEAEKDQSFSTPEVQSEDDKLGEACSVAEPRKLVTALAEGTRKTLVLNDTPTRRALRKAVEDTVAAVNNSPKINLPERMVKRLGTNLGARPRDPKPANKPESSKKPSSPFSALLKRANSPTPEVLRRARAARQQKAVKTKVAAHQEVVQTKFFKDQLKAHRKQATNAPTVPARLVPLPIVKPVLPTEPKPFSFATDSRVRTVAQKSSEENMDFTKMLRTYKAAPTNTSTSNVSGHTQVKPFNFSNTTGRRARSVEPSPLRPPTSRFVSTAELMKKFQQSTPDRFHSVPRGRSSSLTSRNRRRSPSPQLTRGLTPRLLTRDRSRPTNAPTREQLEELELEEARKNQFRAKSINEGIKPSKPVHIEKKAPTKVEPFNLTSLPPKPFPMEDEPSYEFHAKPIPKRIFEGPVGIPERREIDVVVPQSPAFALRERLKERKRPAPTGDESSNEDRNVKARPAPHFGVPVLIPKSTKKTVPEPFSFFERDAAMVERKQQKIAALEEEERNQREFKAKPAPNVNKPVNLPIKQVMPCTNPEPFDIQIEKRVEERLQKRQEDLEREVRLQREATIFKARPATILEKEPFMPKPSDKPLSEVSNFELHSDRRAREREEYDLQLKHKEAQLESVKRQMEEQRRLEEEREIQRARREAVHKAQPVKTYKPIQIHPSDKPLTNPVSPKFHNKKSSRGSSTASSSQSNLDETYELNRLN